MDTDIVNKRCDSVWCLRRWIHEKVKEHLGWVEKKLSLWKKAEWTWTDRCGWEN